MGVDLGTANTLVYVRGRGIVINEPSVVAVNQKTGEILAIGNEAKSMVGRTPSHISAIRPLVQGVISDFEVTTQMLSYFIEKVHSQKLYLFPRPRMVIGIPYGVTEVEKKAVEDAARDAGAREAYLIEEPMAAAIGARLPVQEANGVMVVDIGGGTSEIAVISLGGIVVARSLRIAGDKLNEDIVQYVRDEFKLLLGERTAEEVKIRIGSAHDENYDLETAVRGRDLVTGLPREVKLRDDDVRKATKRSVSILVNAIKDTIEDTPPELVADIMERGILLTGGGSLLRGLATLITKETGILTNVDDDPLTTVVRGAGIILEKIDELEEVLVAKDYYKATPR